MRVVRSGCAMRMRPVGRRGFTLIELVISASISAIILVAAYMCLGAGVSSRKVIEPRAEVIQNARVALAMITADLRCACALSKATPFLGIERTIRGQPFGNMDFGTHNYMPRRPREADFCQVSYFVDQGSEPGMMSLWRRRNPVMAANALEGGNRDEIAQGLRGVKFEYYDGYDWYTTWGQLKSDKPNKNAAPSGTSLLDDSNLYGMPEAVRITLMFDSEPIKRAEGEEETADDPQRAPPMVFQTVVRLELASLNSGASSLGASPTGAGATGNNPNQQGGN